MTEQQQAGANVVSSDVVADDELEQTAIDWVNNHGNGGHEVTTDVDTTVTVPGGGGQQIDVTDATVVDDTVQNATVTPAPGVSAEESHEQDVSEAVTATGQNGTPVTEQGTNQGMVNPEI